MNASVRSLCNSMLLLTDQFFESFRTFDLAIFYTKKLQFYFQHVLIYLFIHDEDPWLKKHTFQNIFKFQNVKFECLHSYIKILNKNIRI